MSYDVLVNGECINHTYNGSEACEVILGFRPGKFDGMKADEVADLCLIVYSALKDNPERYEEYMPANKWGTIESWKNFMLQIIKACDYNPNDIVRVA